MLLAPLALCLLAPLAAPVAQAAEDPITGTWELQMTGDVGGLPPEGLPVVLGLERLGPTEVRVSLELQQARTDGIAGLYDEGTGSLTFQGSFMGIGLDSQLVLAGETANGTMSGMGLAVELAGRRISHELPALLDEPITAPADLSKLTPEDWRVDLETLAERLPARHVNAFHSISREQWEQRVEQLDARLGGLDARGSALALAQLVALVGDAHTELDWRSLPLWSRLPLTLRSFDDGLFVIGAAEAYAELLGARIVRIGSLPVDEALQRVATTFAAENDSWRREKLPGLLLIPELLATLGVAADQAAISFALEHTPGEPFEVVLRPQRSSSQLRAPDPEFEPLPLWLTRTRENYWFQALPEARAVYCAYNRCAEDPARPIAPFIEELLVELEARDARRLVLDLRHNAGGNSSVLSMQLPALFASERLQSPGALVVLIGPRTYSSGMMNAQQLREGGALLLGEPTGGKPNSYGELRSFQLPRSGLRVSYSTQLFRMLDEDPPSVEPDERVPLRSFDWLSARDPVLERALERPLAR